MAFAIFEIIWDTSTNIYVIYFNIHLTGLRPWISWENVHSNFSRVGTFPHFLIPSSLMTQFTWQWWIIPISCLFFVIFFGFGEEAMADYRKAITLLCHAVSHPFIKPRASSELPIHRCCLSSSLYISVLADICMFRVGLALHGTLSSASDAFTMHEKTWDEIPFKTPEVTKRSLCSTTEPPFPSSGDTRLTTTQRPSQLSVIDAPMSCETPSTSSISDSFSPSHHVPEATGTSPTSGSVAHAVVIPDFHSNSQLLPPSCEGSISSARLTAYRPTSTDFGITVSQGYRPEHDITFQYHDETLLTPEARGYVPSLPEATRTP